MPVPAKQTIVENFAEHAGRAKFRGYVQRVAFSIVLSEPMIRMLRIVRDYPAHTNERYDHKKHWDSINMKDGYHADLFIKEITALERRGLAYHNPSPKGDPYPEGHVFYKLTRAGELMCEMLIEAGLMRDIGQ